MSKLVNIIKNAGIIAGTGLASYGGFELGDSFKDYFSQLYMIPEIVQGFTGFLVGAVGGTISTLILREMPKDILKKYRRLKAYKRFANLEDYYMASLSTFVNEDNDSKNLSAEKSLEEISNNLVEVKIMKDDETISAGSGLMVTNNGFVITAQHVINRARQNNYDAIVKTQDGTIYPVTKMWGDEARDTALIKAEKPSADSKPIKIKINKECKLLKGEEIVALGYCQGIKYNTMGRITEPDKLHKIAGEDKLSSDLFEADACVKEGQSGGAIANSEGELIGITSYKSKKQGEVLWHLGGAKISTLLNCINNEIITKKSA